MRDAVAVDADLEAERPALLRAAYRMLCTVADAEDAVQEAYVRWFRLGDEERSAIAAPGAWLTRVTGRICLDMLGSARARRELYVGEWLPEPVPEGWSSPAADPADRAERDDEVSMALLVVLDALTPAERVALVLHEAFALSFADIAEIVGRSVDATRQLASSARRRLRERREGMAPRGQHDELVRAFAAACASGEVAQLAAVLDPEVVLRSDGGGLVSAARRPVVGLDRVGRFLFGLAAQHPDSRFVPVVTGDGLGFAVSVGGSLHSVWTLNVEGERVTDIWIVANPQKLALWVGVRA